MKKVTTYTYYYPQGGQPSYGLSTLYHDVMK